MMLKYLSVEQIPTPVIPGEGREGHLDVSPPHTHYISLLTDLHQSRLSLPMVRSCCPKITYRYGAAYFLRYY